METGIKKILFKRWALGRMVLENVLVGALMGALMGIFLQRYLKALTKQDLDWVIFLVIGLVIGLFSGFARQSLQRYKTYGEKLTVSLRKNKDKLVTTEERYKNLLDQANDMIFLLDEKSNFVEMNGKFEEILGYEREKWVGRSMYDIISSNERDEAIKYCWETLKGGTPRFDLKAINYKGRVVYLALANSPVRDSEGKIIGIMGIARDISASKNLEELQNKFVSHVSHELRTPLTAMREFIALLIDGIPGKLNQEQVKYCSRVRFNIDRLTRIIDNLLLLSRADEGRIVLEKQLIDLKELIVQAQDIFKISANKKNIRIKMIVAHNLPEVYADQGRIIQVLTNLLGNAIKFTPEGGEITIGARDSREDVIIWVQDTGIGIKPQDQERIFDRFQQIRDENTFSQTGTGLGLAITREIIGLHRGEIRVESEPGVGSKFTISLPKTLAPLILLVDDEPDLLAIYRDFLEPLHYRISTASNGEEAVVKAFDELPDLIILDIAMPRMNGYEVMGRLNQNKQTRNIPIIILTGYGLDRDRLDHFGRDSFPALRKPINMKEFLAAITDVLEKRDT
ncbi:MAG: ATP-binding protein [Candidatus Auribacterota bacterium]|nr:ATP-binding protein [Candidatus Auribacterota bacterium]